MKCVSAPYITFICIFIAVHSCSIVCDNRLHKSIFLTTVLPQEMHSCYHTCTSVLICKLLWSPSCKNFVIIQVIVIDRMYRSTANVQIAGYVCNSNLSVLLHQTIHSFNAVHYSCLDGLSSHHQYLFCHSRLFPSIGETNTV